MKLDQPQEEKRTLQSPKDRWNIEECDRFSVNEVDYVLYSDGVYTVVVEAEDFDEPTSETDYSFWCSGHPCISNKEVLRIAANRSGRCVFDGLGYTDPEDESTTEKWTVSIDEELFGPPAAECGLEVSLLVDPENHTVTTWSTVGSGCPESVYHSRALRISVSDTHHSGDLAEYLRESTGLLDEIADLYLGSEWDGSNHVGEWDGDPLGLAQKIEHDISLEVPQYHDFSDDISHAGLTEEILRQVEEYGVENCADAFISGALDNCPPIYYDRDDVIEAIEQVVENTQSE